MPSHTQTKTLGFLKSIRIDSDYSESESRHLFRKTYWELCDITKMTKTPFCWTSIFKSSF